MVLTRTDYPKGESSDKSNEMPPPAHPPPFLSRSSLVGGVQDYGELLKGMLKQQNNNPQKVSGVPSPLQKARNLDNVSASLTVLVGRDCQDSSVTRLSPSAGVHVQRAE